MRNTNEYRTNMSKPEVNIISARCSRHGKLFGIRFEKIGEIWVGTWAFPMREESASREGYNRNEIRGQFAFDEKYPGCPYCNADSLFKCSCGKVGCYTRDSKSVKCSWCHVEGIIEGTVDSLTGGGDR